MVRGVTAGSPAATAGIAPGDRVLAIDDADAERMNGVEASRRIRGEGAGNVSLKLSRAGRPYTVRVGRERLSALVAREGMKVVAGNIVPLDTSEAEIRHMAEFDGRRIVFRVFPQHYASDPGAYGAGFEVFVLRDPDAVVVGGVEKGPASRAGLHWGDRILSVNGQDPKGRTLQALEQMFSSAQPQSLRLTVERDGRVRTLSLRLEKTEALLAANGLRLAQGQVIPIGLADDDVRCFAGR